MQKLVITTIAMSLLLLVGGCSSNSQTVQQRQACTTGDPHPWCMQMAQTKPLGTSPYGLENKDPTNPEMRDDITPYPVNPALSIRGEGVGPTTFSGSSGYSGLGSISGIGGMGGMK
jgi:hypothetical protein